jgi:hypothetical protein
LDSIANLVERIEGLVNNKIRISPTPLQRKKLANASNGHYIETVWGRGCASRSRPRQKSRRELRR